MGEEGFDTLTSFPLLPPAVQPAEYVGEKTSPRSNLTQKKFCLSFSRLHHLLLRKVSLEILLIVKALLVEPQLALVATNW